MFLRITLELQDDDAFTYLVLHYPIDETEEYGVASDRYRLGTFNPEDENCVGILESITQSDTYSGLLYELHPVRIRFEMVESQGLLLDLSQLESYRHFTWPDGKSENVYDAIKRLYQENQKLKNRIHILENELGDFIVHLGVA